MQQPASGRAAIKHACIMCVKPSNEHQQWFLSVWQSITGQLRGPHPLFTLGPSRSGLLVADLAPTEDDARSAQPTQQRC